MDDDWPLTGDCGDTVRSDPLGHRMVSLLDLAQTCVVEFVSSAIGLNHAAPLPFWGGTP